jgi:sulfur-carrier protein adenylyltransferase/sulfurtransferase
LRSRAAAGILSGAGFKEAYSMAGGINAWKGLVAEGAPESGMAYFSPATKPEELIGLAWFLEDGSRRFYSELAASLPDNEAKDLYDQLAKAEEHHQTSLRNLYQDFSGKASDPGFPDSVIPPGKGGDVMEGGMLVKEALQWAKGEETTDILELCISLETNAYDLYLKMDHQMKDQRSAQVFSQLSLEEKQHLERLSSFLEKRI